MSENIRPAVEVWLEAYEASYYDDFETDDKAAAVIEADREAVRAPLLAEIERLLEALEDIKKAAFYYTLPKPALDIIHKRACAALAGDSHD